MYNIHFIRTCHLILKTNCDTISVFSQRLDFYKFPFHMFYLSVHRFSYTSKPFHTRYTTVFTSEDSYDPRLYHDLLRNVVSLNYIVENFYHWTKIV